MPIDRHVEVTYKKKPSFLERIGKSLSGIAFGAILFLISFVVLYYNEGNSVEVFEVLEMGQQQVLSFDKSRRGSFDNKLVHFTGDLNVDEKITDWSYQVTFSCAKLRRTVEMYQWVEHVELKEVDEGEEIRQERTYVYATEWSSKLEKSFDFSEELGHENPKSFTIESQDFAANSVFIDDVLLSSTLASKINWFEAIDPLPSTSKSGVHVHGKYYFYGIPDEPKVGDYRVSYQCAGRASTPIHSNPMSEKVSVVAKYSSNRFENFPVTSKRSIEWLYRGTFTPDEIFTSQKAGIQAFTWLMRLAGFICMFVGLSILSRIVVTIVDWIPIVREIVSASVTMFNFTLALCLTLITIAICWLRFHPLFGSAVLAASAVPWVISKQRASTQGS